MFSRIGDAAFKKDLTNTIALCAALENPQQKFKTIHVAGTNGKGSASHMLAAILQTAGYKTGLYTSPHLKDFRERIKVNGQLCGESFVIEFTERIKPEIEKLSPSFFEITVAMAFEYFAQQQVDVAVVEVGLGGRFDSTNVIVPQLCVITNIGLDHTHILGDTLAKIAFEKAGIIKPGIPAVVGEVLPETQPVFEEKAFSVKAPLVFAQDKWNAVDWAYQHNHLQVNVEEKRNGERKMYELDLPGIYQTKNLVTVLEAVHQLRLAGWDIKEAALHKALANAKHITGLAGRWQQVQQHPAVILDVAHNEDGIKQLVQQIELCTYQHLHIVLGMVKDKDVSSVLALLPKTAAYYFTKAQIPRALPEDDLLEKARQAGLDGKAFADVHAALEQAKQHAHANDMIIVCGSVFLVAEVL